MWFQQFLYTISFIVLCHKGLITVHLFNLIMTQILAIIMLFSSREID